MAVMMTRAEIAEIKETKEETTPKETATVAISGTSSKVTTSSVPSLMTERFVPLRRLTCSTRILRFKRH